LKNKIILISISIAVFIFILWIFIQYKKSTRNAVDAFAANGRMINVLIAGSNVFKSNKHDFYAILSINSENSKIGLTLLPPDFRVNLDGKGKRYNKISEVDINDFKKLSASLEKDLKFNIPFYVVIYSPDVERIVDLVEGVELFILEDVNIQGIKPGLNYFDGDKINQYINSVKENSIYKKYDRIQDILLTLYYNKDKYEKYCTIEFVSEVLKTIKTNLLDQEIISLAKILYKKESNLLCTIVPGSLNETGYYITDDISFSIYKRDFLRRLFVDREIEQQIKIKLLNGTDIPGLARKLRYKFVNEGINVMEIGTAPNQMFENTLIINSKGDLGPARRISEILGVDRIYHSVDSMQMNNVLVIIGMDMAKKK
jgi:anionic cell wall polymer biosynthesis LytR-Cps2A-Psr (LCP) family protein